MWEDREKLRRRARSCRKKRKEGWDRCIRGEENGLKEKERNVSTWYVDMCGHALPCVVFQTHLGIELEWPTASSSGVNGEVGRFVDNAPKGF